MPKVRLVVSKETGNVSIKVEGVKGRSCKTLTDDVEKALGVNIATELTREYHETAIATDIRQQN